MMTAEQKQMIELSIEAHKEKIKLLEGHILIANRLTARGIANSVIELDLHFFDPTVKAKVDAGKITKITQAEFKAACQEVLTITKSVLENMEMLLEDK